MNDIFTPLSEGVAQLNSRFKIDNPITVSKAIDVKMFEGKTLRELMREGRSTYAHITALLNRLSEDLCQTPTHQ